ncbi:glycosyltransferase family 90 protein [Dothistroma septosporum NZE10]|uniref:Glycosyltransferase family 90 protein n=1 Tax=Dothistroma septosporum (strain NZE10 / CBS 128990) TaxID=675120 RepID=N1PBZ0_DOTSN|nr:glycosyltransferase family 90 protein [Dothistroma septosporum NZE10]
MDRAKWPAISGLLVGIFLVTRAVPSSFAFDKTVHTSIATLATSGGAILAASRWIAKRGDVGDRHGRYGSVLLNEIGEPHTSRSPSPSRDQDEGAKERYPGILRRSRVYFVLLVLALCLRAEVLREVIRNVQCGTTSWTPLLPIAFALWDWWSVQRKTKRRRTISESDDDAGDSVYDALERNVVSTPYSFLVAVILVGLGGMRALSSTSVPGSTFICAAVLPYGWLVPQLQRLGSALDLVIVFCVAQLVVSHGERGARSTALRFASTGYALLFSAAVLLTIGIAYFIIQAEDRTWITTIPYRYVWSVAKLDLYIAFSLVCALVTLVNIGLMTTALLATFTSIMTITTASAWSNGHPFPPSPIGSAFIGICLAIFGFMSYVHLESVAGERSNSSTGKLFYRVPSMFYLALLILFFTWTGLWASHRTSVSFHPIDMLIYEAQGHHQAYLNQASASQSLGDAVKNYRARYQRAPPAGFHHWYQYATERNTTVIDSFDSIHRDLLPFYGLTPRQIRDRTWELVANPWNDIAGIRIRNGKVDISPNVVPTHKWMLEGILEMVGKFAEWLPDMDLAFNLNDECRVNAPLEDLKSLLEAGEYWGRIDDGKRKVKPFSTDRTKHWFPPPGEPEEKTPLREMSWQYTFHRLGNNGCPKNSPARTQRLWDTSSLCTSCMAPQSLGAFLANWTVAADICHQPDLADLHGLYMSPAAFKIVDQLYPVFSQSKAHGFNDVLYPSAWNYLDKAKYDPNNEHPDKSFPEKANTLFWRGATSEGVSQGRGQWRGMTRQRFVHLTNNVNNTSPHQPLLLPLNEDGSQLSYQNLPVSKLTELFPTDVHVVDSIARCAGPDCENQAREFAPLVGPIDFQQHWNYKFLLDLDGAGFSGRFLAFLQSKSLPFKAALFREWWDDRLTPWHHFVPLDIRGHGLWATLAYFHGIEGIIEGKKGQPGALEVKIDAHARDAERIAMEGRAWAGRVLRKEDMEIYFFRLLLEWGRLTDENRDEIGFEMNVDGTVPE